MAEEYRKVETIVRETRVTDISTARIVLEPDLARVFIDTDTGGFDRPVPFAALGKDEAAFRAYLDTLRKLAVSDFEVVNVDIAADPVSPLPPQARVP
jgi:hypothetical protein